MEQLPKEILLNEILLKLPGKDVFNACIISKKFEKICNDDRLWFQLLQRDFKYDLFDFEKDSLNLKLTNKDLYKLLYGLQVVQKFLDENTNAVVVRNLHKLYYLKNLNLSRQALTSIPKELGVLHNLEILNLSHNSLTSVPKELGQLRNLQKLYLYNNYLKSIPKELRPLINFYSTRNFTT